MGTISRFDLSRIVDRFGVNAYIEIGVGLGASLTHAATVIANVCGCECNKDVHQRFLARTSSEPLRRCVRQSSSAAFLAQPPDSETGAGLCPLLYLDAHHISRTDFVRLALTNTAGSASAPDFQLAEELAALLGKSLIGAAMIVIGDGRFYQDTECFAGPLPEAMLPNVAARQAVAAVLESFAPTHRLDVLPHDEAYLVLLPRAWGVDAWELALVRRGDRYTRPTVLPGVAGATSISMMRRVHDARFATRFFVGHGVDIGGKVALDKFRFAFPLTKSVVNYDQPGWDAQQCANIADDEFDFLYSSHCLEHVADPRLAFGNWLRVVRPGGWLVVDVPDEDLYEQGVFPSRFSTGHQHSFNLSKPESLSPRSISLLEFLLNVRQQCEVHSVQRLDHVAHVALLNKGRNLTQTPFDEAGIEIIVRKLAHRPAVGQINLVLRMAA